MECKRRDVDFRSLIGAERCKRCDGRHNARKIGEAPAVESVVGGESNYFTCRAIDPDPGSHPKGVPLYSGLKLLEAIVGEADGAIWEESSRQSIRIGRQESQEGFSRESPRWLQTHDRGGGDA